MCMLTSLPASFVCVQCRALAGLANGFPGLLELAHLPRALPCPLPHPLPRLPHRPLGRYGPLSLESVLVT